MDQEKFGHPLTDQEAAEKKMIFFRDLALEHMPEGRLLLQGGKLWKKEGWRNVVAHCLVQVAAGEELIEMLDLSEEDRKKLLSVAMCHDWKKRLDKKPEEFSEEERKEAEELLAKVNPDPHLMAATGQEIHERMLFKDESSILEKLQFYIDGISKGSEIVPILDRMAEVKGRRPELDEDSEYLKKYGKPFFENERELCIKVEKEIFDMLKERGYPIGSQEEIPAVIKERIREKIEKRSKETEKI